jgi:3,4-dihydroxy 2-butanone 4-phosphate synthase/GTP cyclohydrolase II
MLDNIKDAIEDIKQGKMIIVVDDEDRENEGDIVMAADAVSYEAINFMAIHARGLSCVPSDRNRAKDF